MGVRRPEVNEYLRKEFTVHAKTFDVMKAADLQALINAEGGIKNYCSKHNLVIRKDESMWLAHASDFIDLQSSDAGYGEDEFWALMDYYVNVEITKRKNG